MEGVLSFIFFLHSVKTLQYCHYISLDQSRDKEVPDIRLNISLYKLTPQFTVNKN